MRIVVLVLVLIGSFSPTAQAKHDILRHAVRQYVKNAELQMPARVPPLPALGGTYIRERDFRWR